jgi:hypothetical protein
MKKYLILLFALSAFLISGCQKEKLLAIHNKDQSLSYNSGNEVISQKIDGVKIKFEPTIYKIDGGPRYLVIGLTIENDSKKDIVIDNSMIAVSFQKNGSTENEFLKNSSKEDIQSDLNTKQFWSGLSRAFDRPTTYAGYFAKPLNDKQDEMKEKEKDANSMQDLNSVLVSDTIEKGGKIKRLVIPRANSIPHGIYTALVTIAGNKYRFQFKFDTDIEPQKKETPSQNSLLLN